MRWYIMVYKVLKKTVEKGVKFFLVLALVVGILSIPPFNVDVEDWGTEMVYATVDAFHFSNSATVNNQTVNRVTKVLSSCKRFKKERKLECKLNRINDWVRNSITYDNSYFDTPSYATVVARGEGRCVGQAIVFASLAESAGIDTYYVYQPRHICVMYRKYGKTGLWNCIEDEDILQVSKVVPS